MSTVSSATKRATRLLVERIQRRMDDLGTNAAAVSKKAGLGKTAVHDIMTGKNKNPSVPVISALAKPLECTIAYLVGEQDEPQGFPAYVEVGAIPIIGVAETGAFRRMADFDDDGLPKIHALKSRDYKNARHFALKIRGDSMNNAKPYPLLEGMIVLCVDIIDAEIEIESGRIYAIRRTLDGGQTYECTVKRAKVFRDRYELHPESYNDAHKPLIIARGSGAEDPAGEITAIGLVYGVSFEGEI